MREQRQSPDTRLDAALDAMRNLPTIDRDDVERVAARAVLAAAPASTPFMPWLRVAAILTVFALGAAGLATLRRSPASDTASAQVPALLVNAAATTFRPVTDAGSRPIIFELDAPDARTVQVLGDFNGWSRGSTSMVRGTDGRWRLTTLLPPGRYVYAFLVDGRRFERDPMRDPVEDRDFGVTGSELVVGEAP